MNENYDKDLAKYIDHTKLSADATDSDIKKLCDEAKQYGFASVCVNPTHVHLAADLLKNSSTKVCSVIGFPLGATTTETKAFETKNVIKKGATEVDMVMNIGALKSGNPELVQKDIEAVVQAASKDTVVKVIIETALLTKNEIVKACKLVKAAGADFVKTSTGFSTAGAKLEYVKLMRQTVGEKMGVKAAGGIKTREDAQNMIAAGATRIGASGSIGIVKGSKDKKTSY